MPSTVSVQPAGTRRQMAASLDAPVRNMDQPMMGIRKLEVLEMNLKSRCRWNSV